MKVVVQGASVFAPGLNGWTSALPILRSEEAWQYQPMEKPKPTMLPPNERRRTTELIKLSLQAADEAREQSGCEANALACVFASSDGDTFIVDRLCDALALPERPISPTLFHNSVHNAAAGYWAIAAGAKLFSTSISAGIASFAAGLLEAMSFVAAEREPVLLVSYDVALPATLDAFGTNHESFASALVLAPEEEPGMAVLTLQGLDKDGGSTPPPAGLEPLREANSAAEALPLLAGLANGESASLRLAHLDGGTVSLDLEPC